MMFARSCAALRAATRLVATLLAGLVLSGALVGALAPSAHAQGRSFTTIRDAETESLLRSIYGPLFAAAGLNRGFVRVTIIRDRSINAFVTTGNRMFINTGLIMQVDGVGELAGVLAHETGHVVGGHIARLPEEMRNAMIRSVAAMLLGAAAAVATGQGGAAGVGAAAGSSVAMRELFSFTRTQENAADLSAVTTLRRVGWPVEGLVRLMERLQDQEMLIADRQDPYLRTHPLTRDRIDFLREQIARSPDGDGAFPPGMQQRFTMVRAKLYGFLEGGAAIARQFPASDVSPPARYARAIQAFRVGRIDDAVAAIDAMIAVEPSSPWLHEVKGQMLHEGGRPREAIGPYQQAARLAPGEPLIRASLARVLVSIEEPAQLRAAVTEAEAALRMDNSMNMAWNTLGLARGRLGQEGLAALALAEEAAIVGDLLTQRQMAARAERLLPPGAAKLRAQDLSNAARIEREERRRR